MKLRIHPFVTFIYVLQFSYLDLVYRLIMKIYEHLEDLYFLHYSLEPPRCNHLHHNHYCYYHFYGYYHHHYYHRNSGEKILMMMKRDDFVADDAAKKLRKWWWSFTNDANINYVQLSIYCLDEKIFLHPWEQFFVH